MFIYIALINYRIIGSYRENAQSISRMHSSNISPQLSTVQI